MESGIENIVATSAMLLTDTGSKSLPMSKTQCRSEANYAVAIRIFRDMKENGLISEEEYSEIDTIIANKTASILADLCR